jgi:RNase H-like domain found in reverse transcriptase/Reverse transcriptase (RNA-dependent DNA polymerase)
VVATCQQMSLFLLVGHKATVPHLESELAKVVGSTCFATFDFSSGYFQLPLHPDSQEFQFFICPDGIFSPTRVVQGNVNATAHFQYVFDNLLVRTALDSKLLRWLDDFLAHSDSESAHLVLLHDFFSVCAKHGLKLYARKCVLFTKTARWCGRLISGNGVKFDSDRLQGLLDMPCPTGGADLQQFMYALNWIRSSMPMYNALVSPLNLFLETVYAAAGARTKKEAGKTILGDLGWNASHTEAFQQCKGALAAAATRAHPRDEMRFCVFTDASQTFWSAVVTQVPPRDLDKPLADQQHEPLAFISGALKGASSRWPFVEKEASAIVETTDRLDYFLLHPNGFSLFCDHRNFSNIYLIR